MAARLRCPACTLRGVVVTALVALILGGPLLVVPAGAAGPVVEGAADLPVPSDEVFVRAAHRDLAGREPTAAELSAGLAALAAGRTRTEVASDLTHGPEHAGLVVDRLYVRILGRPAEPAGRAFWAARLGSGVRVATLAAQIYGSPEYFGLAGGTPGTYVDTVYLDLLGRAADPSGRAYWVGRVSAGESRTVLARLLFLSRESNALRTVLGYYDLLRRRPWPDAQAYWAQRLVTTDDLEVEALLVGSQEYFTLAPTLLPEWPLPASVSLTSGGDDTDPSISGDGRFVAYTSRPTVGAASAINLIDLITGRLRVLARGNGHSTSPDVSADGSWVVFQSEATNLVPSDVNGRRDIFRVPTAGGAVERLTAGNGDSSSPRVDGDGSVVVFSSTATDLVPGDPDDTADVFVRSAPVGGTVTVERIGGNGPSSQPGVSADGTTVAFLSKATDLAPGDTDVATDVYVAPLPRSGGGVVTLLSEESPPPQLDSGYGPPSLSTDGRSIGYSVGQGVVATVTGAGIERQQVGEGLTYFVDLSDDATAAYAYGIDLTDTYPRCNGVFHRPVDAAPVPAGSHGSVSSDGTSLVSDSDRCAGPSDDRSRIALSTFD